jgi:hypothetical protein
MPPEPQQDERQRRGQDETVRGWSLIEPCWSKIKTALRDMKGRMRVALNDALANVIRKINNSDARGWFRHCGYSIHWYEILFRSTDFNRKPCELIQLSQVKTRHPPEALTTMDRIPDAENAR